MLQGSKNTRVNTPDRNQAGLIFSVENNIISQEQSNGVEKPANLMKFYHLIDEDPANIPGRIVSIIGGGGKSTLIATLARELKQKKISVIVTCTTKMQALKGIPLVLQDNNPDFTYEVNALIEEQFHSLCRGCHVEQQRLGEESGPTRQCIDCHTADEAP